MFKKWWHWPVAAFVLWMLAAALAEGDSGLGARVVGAAVGTATDRVLNALLDAWPVTLGFLAGGVSALYRRSEERYWGAKAAAERRSA